MKKLELLRRVECWINGGISARFVAKGKVLATDCIASEGVCPHIVDCLRGKIHKPASEGGELMTDNEIGEYFKKEWEELQELKKRYPAFFKEKRSNASLGDKAQ